MSSDLTSPNEDVTLHCPSCGEEKFKLLPMVGKNGECFVRIHCHNCTEHLFFQTPELPKNINSLEDIPETWKTEQIKNLQQEWEEWFRWKQRHLSKPISRKSTLSKYAQWVLALLLGASTSISHLKTDAESCLRLS